MEPGQANVGIHEYAVEYYKHYAQKATEDLATFASSLTPQKPVVVTYFDEADELKVSFWILLRLIIKQAEKTCMWYVFVGTELDISLLTPAPTPDQSESLDFTYLTISQGV